MSTWSTGSFDNDDAVDFLAGLQGVEDLSAIEHAIESVEEGGRSVEAYAGATCIAAIEVLAALMGRAGDAFEQSAEATDWVDDVKCKVGPRLAARAARVLSYIVGDESELRQQWEETDELSDWLRDVNDLQARID